MRLAGRKNVICRCWWGVYSNSYFYLLLFVVHSFIIHVCSPRAMMLHCVLSPLCPPPPLSCLFLFVPYAVVINEFDLDCAVFLEFCLFLHIAERLSYQP